MRHKQPCMKFEVFLLLIFFSGAIKGQDKIWIKQTKVSEAIAFERAVDPAVTFLDQSVGLAEGYYPLHHKYKVTTKPVIAKRIGNNSLSVYAEYFFTPKDSLIRLVSYDWEKDKYGNFFNKQKIWKSEADSFDLYNSTYEEVRSQIINEFGMPTTTDDTAKVNQSKRGEYLTRESIWEREKLHIELSMIFESMTYRVRMTYYWKE